MASLAVPSLTILDVGHGSCAILAEAARIVVFDAGPKSGLLEFLLQHQICTIDLVMISHADRDHIEGLIAILGTNAIAIKMVRLNTDSLKGSDLWDDLLFELDSLQKQGKTDFSPALTEGDSRRFDCSRPWSRKQSPRPPKSRATARQNKASASARRTPLRR